MQRFTISLDDALARHFDSWISQHGYSNRSEAVRDLLRDRLQQVQLRDGAAPHCVACLSYVYDHHERDLAERLTALQHQHHDLAVSAMHVHLNHEHCLETIILRGPTGQVSKLAESICAERGVHHGHLNLVAVDLHQPHRHGRSAAHAPHVHLKPSH